MEVVEDDYYTVLGVPRDATQAQIRKAYIRKARDSHPDKNPGDPRAEEKFKLITEAYSVLSDETKKVVYDRHGRVGVQKEAARGDINEVVDAYRSIFGSGKFDDTFGELTFFNTLFMNNATTLEEQRKKQLEISKKQETQRKKIINHLVIKLEPYVTGAVEAFEDMTAISVAYKLEATSGAALLKLVGETYVEVAQQYFGGFVGFFSSLSEKGTFASHFFTALSSTVKLHSANQVSVEQDHDTKLRALSSSVDAIWSLGKIEISRLLHDVCKAVLAECGQNPSVLVARAEGLYKLGMAYIEAANHSLLLRNKPTEYDLPEYLASKFK